MYIDICVDWRICIYIYIHTYIHMHVYFFLIVACASGSSRRRRRHRTLCRHSRTAFVESHVGQFCWKRGGGGRQNDASFR